MKIGTAISKVATPIAGALGMDCYDPQTKDLKPESPCAKARAAADEGRWRDAISARFPMFDQFWSTQPHEENTNMKEYGVNCVIKAENLAELEKKLAGAEIVSVQVRPPKPVVAPRPPMVPGIPGAPVAVSGAPRPSPTVKK